MSLDSVTEKIAHFVGTFDLTIEQARLRDQYEEFTALRRKVELEELEDPITIRIKADLDLDPGEYDPLPFRFKTPPADPDAPPAPQGPAPATVIYLEPNLDDAPPLPDAALGSAAASLQTIVLQPQIVTDLIGSAVTYTFQSLFLRDNDVVGEGEFRDVDEMIALMEAAADLAATLHAFASPSFSIEDYLSIEYVEAMAEAMLTPINAVIEGVTVYQFHGEDAEGMIVNGEYVDEIPVWEDLLPDYHQPEEVEEEEGPNPLPAEWDQGDEAEFAEGHTVVTGGNLGVNAVTAKVSWIDAPFIAVGGQAIGLTLISQVGVASDVDQGVEGTGSLTDVINASEISTEDKAAPWLQENAGTGQPDFLTVDWIHGDLIVANFIHQDIDATDIDHIQTDFTADTTLYALGDNELTDVTNLLQLGNFYDLVMIDGNMVSVDLIHQTLVLMDDDIVTGVSPVAYPGTDDNLLMNNASVLTEGRDTHDTLHDPLADAMALDATDMDGLEDALLNDPLFAGMEQMRVLKIDGDLLQANIIKQVTMLADQDDIHLSGDAAADAMLVAGSNALLNTAEITKAGIDSSVMAADGSFSDLLLHQASLIDVPKNEELTELTNEAIAMLMDDINMPVDNSTVGSKGADLTPEETTGSSDGLQTMLA